MTQSNLDAFLDYLVERIATRVVEKLGGADSQWVDQSSSQLGSRRHRAAVNRRIAEGLPGATKVGRKHLLTREALAEELATVSKKRRATTETDVQLEARIRKDLGL